MGFGLLALGYIFLCFYSTGADLIGYIVMLVAILKLSKNVGKEFKKCAIAILILIPVGCFNLFGFVDTVFELGIMKEEYTKVSYDEETLEELGISLPASSEAVDNGEGKGNTEKTDDIVESSKEGIIKSSSKRSKGAKIADAVFNALFIFGSLCFHYFFYQAIIPLCEKTRELKRKSKAKRNSAINIFFFSLWGLITAGGANLALVTAVTLAHFPVIILNFIFIHGCFVTFAYQSDVEDDEEDE